MPDEKQSGIYGIKQQNYEEDVVESLIDETPQTKIQ